MLKVRGYISKLDYSTGMSGLCGVWNAVKIGLHQRSLKYIDF